MLQALCESVQKGQGAFYRYITANDVGITGGHQAGFYVPKQGAGILFDELGEKGANKDKLVRITWQDGQVTDSRFVYYGQGTRNEYRITRFGRSFPFLQECYVGSLLVLVKQSECDYEAYVLSSDEEIDGFFGHYGLTPTAKDCILLPKSVTNRSYAHNDFIELFLSKYDDFPNGQTMAFWGQKYQLCCSGLNRQRLLKEPDNTLLAWIDAEYQLYQALEAKLYAPICDAPLGSIAQLLELANTILNRRKSRAGRSLELHLERLMQRFGLLFETQVRTEGNKRPDFIFPSAAAYHSISFAKEKLLFLAAKTTCKDRWRQILNEADRIEHKYLFTLQKGVSLAQLREMEQERVSLVVPQAHISSFAKEYQAKIYTLGRFVQIVQQSQL